MSSTARPAASVEPRGQTSRGALTPAKSSVFSFMETASRSVLSRWRAGSLSEVAHDMRAHSVGDGLRESLPKRNERAVLGVERIVLRHGVALQQQVFIRQWYGFETPVLLEV